MNRGQIEKYELQSKMGQWNNPGKRHIFQMDRNSKETRGIARKMGQKLQESSTLEEKY